MQITAEYVQDNAAELEQQQAATRRAHKREKRLSKLQKRSTPSHPTPLTVNIISPEVTPRRADRVTSPLPPSTRPPSSNAGTANRPASAFSNAFSDGNQSAAVSEEPWAIPRSGRFWGHDDRQSQRGGGRGMRGGGRVMRGGFARGRGGGGRGAGHVSNMIHHGKGGFRADWEEQRRNQPYPNDNVNHHLHLHRPDTPAGQSDTARSAGSGAGWVTVQSKQRTFVSGHSGGASNGEDGEWRHDGWEEIERESDRKTAHRFATSHAYSTIALLTSYFHLLFLAAEVHSSTVEQMAQTGEDQRKRNPACVGMPNLQ